MTSIIENIILAQIVQGINKTGGEVEPETTLAVEQSVERFRADVGKAKGKVHAIAMIAVCESEQDGQSGFSLLAGMAGPICVLSELTQASYALLRLGSVKIKMKETGLGADNPMVTAVFGDDSSIETSDPKETYAVPKGTTPS